MHRLNNVVAVSSSCVCVSSMKRNSEIDRIEEIVGRDTKKVCIAKSIVYCAKCIKQYSTRCSQK